MEAKSKNTIYNYELSVREYIKWYNETYSMDFYKLFRSNIMEYRSYLLNVRKHKGRNLNAKTVNMKLSSLRNFNKYLIRIGKQEELVVENETFVKVQQQTSNPSLVDKCQVDEFRQKILVSGDKRLYALVTLIAYSGLRISEALNLKTIDVSLEDNEMIIRNGKGDKQRIVYISSKTVEAIKDYLKTKTVDGEYLFTSKSGRINRSTINKRFKCYSDKITPHVLRHFFCSHALESGFGVHELRQIVGHASIRSTQIYLNPSIKSIKSKLEEL